MYEGKNSGLPGSCSLFPCDNYRSKPRRVRKHLPSPVAEEDEKMNFESYRSEAEHASSMEGTRSRNLAIKKSFAKFSVLHKTLLNMRITGLPTSVSLLPSTPHYYYRPRFNSIPSSWWSCPPSFTR